MTGKFQIQLTQFFSLLAFKHHLAVEEGHINLCLADVVGLSLFCEFYHVLIQYNQISRLTYLNTAYFVMKA